MPNYNFESIKDEYRDKWDAMVITPSKMPQIKSAAEKILQGQSVYENLQFQTGIPWYFIGMLHLRESNCNFKTHLHNGDSLARKTVRVPAGRPLIGKGPFTFEESALDALKQKKYDKITDWSIERVAYCSEMYNGFGYRGKGIPSPYLWAGTNQYKRGKYIRDHVFDANVVDTQLGSMAVFKYLIDNYVDEPAKTITVDESGGTKSTDLNDPPIEDQVAINAPKANLPRPSTTQMNRVSRTHWWSDWLQWLGFGGAGGTVAVKAADNSGVPQLQEAAHSVQQIAAIVGAFGIIAFLVGLGVYFMYQKKLFKDGVQDGRINPSGGTP